ncbi:MAG: hypothetical protein LBO09_07965 [Candidatus Peribacteria bacterium]|jgi:hypothetical protein|nr:hypothetical protein [Candidatus Peribacteria bacterium]
METTKRFTKLAGRMWVVKGQEMRSNTMGNVSVGKVSSLGVEILIEKERTIDDDGELRIHMDGGKSFRLKELYRYTEEEYSVYPAENKPLIKWRRTKEYFRDVKLHPEYYYTENPVLVEISRTYRLGKRELIRLSSGHYVDISWLERVQ